MEHGECSLVDKLRYATDGGARAVLQIAEFPDHPPDSLQVGEAGELALPVLGISQRDAALLDPDQATTVRVWLDDSRQTGADTLGRPLLHVAEPAVQGSSLDHWDPLVRPSLLMEPRQVRDTAYLDVTVERAVLRDLGWEPFAAEVPASDAADASVPVASAAEAGVIPHDAGAGGLAPSEASSWSPEGGRDAGAFVGSLADASRPESLDAGHADAGGPPDAGAVAARDAFDAGSAMSASGSEGCGCTVGRRPKSQTSSWLIVLLAFALRRSGLAPLRRGLAEHHCFGAVSIACVTHLPSRATHAPGCARQAAELRQSWSVAA